MKPYFSRGGKLLMWHGWSDPQVPAEGSIIYRDGVRQAVGAAADNGLALFMLPGVLHCRGGPGADNFDAMAPITAWVEQGRKPQRIVAARQVEGRVVAYAGFVSVSAGRSLRRLGGDQRCGGVCLRGAGRHVKGDQPISAAGDLTGTRTTVRASRGESPLDWSESLAVAGRPNVGGVRDRSLDGACHD